MCPPTYDFCTTVGNEDCYNYCSGNGVCVEGTCQCNPGYFGDDCSVAGPVTVQKETCIWPITSVSCSIKYKDECYFFCEANRLIALSLSLLLTFIWLFLN